MQSAGRRRGTVGFEGEEGHLIRDDGLTESGGANNEGTGFQVDPLR
jgi:hypothetical protein